jgi:hypothetical protein
MTKGGKTIFSMRGREDLRGQLAAMRKLACRLGWLDRSVDPLDGLEIGRQTVLHGATTQYVDPRLRPGLRGPVKNQVLHEVPLPRSLPSGRGMVAQVALDDRSGPRVLWIVVLNPRADAVPAFVV